MSVRSSRRLNKKLTSPLAFEDEKTPTNSTKKTPNLKKIRKTNDLICLSFNASEIEETRRKSRRTRVKNQEPVLDKCSEFDETGDSTKEKSFSFKENISLFLPNEQKNRRIVKAKRILRSAKKETNKENEESLNVDINENNFALTEEKELLANKSTLCKSDIQNVDDDSSSYIQIKEKEIPDIVDFGTNEEIASTSTHFDDKSVSDKIKSDLNVIVTELPSPISPSTQSLKDEASPYVVVLSSEDLLRPSSSGGSKTSSKRRTYELENSTIDLSLLKSVSGRDSTRTSLTFDDKSDYYETPPPTFSKITQRRRWNKIDSTPYSVSSNPSWVNKTNSETKLQTPTPAKKDLSKQSGKKHTSSIKVPNFAAIHKKAMDKVENIVEYKQRKEERAKMLISGKKPVKEAVISEKKGRKQLRFAPNTSLKDKSPTFIPLPSTPMPRQTKKVFDDSPAITKHESPFTFPQKETFEKKFQSPMFKFSQQREALEKKVRSPVFKFKPTFTLDQIDKKISKIPQMKNFTFKAFKSANERGVLVEKNCNINKFNAPKFNFKDAKILAKNEEIKSIVTKSKPVKNSRDVRKCMIKGVRSNRRFELLMNMRKGK